MTPTLSTFLPPAARIKLQRAAQTPIPADDPLARVKAIEKATQWIKQEYPQFFHIKDLNHETETQ